MPKHIVPMTSVGLSAKSAYALPTGILLIIGEEDQPYLTSLRGVFASVKVKVWDLTNKPIDTLAEIVLVAKKAGISHFITTQIDILKKLLPEGSVTKKTNISNYAGSIIPFKLKDEKFEFLIINPLRQLKSVSYGEFLTEVYISKFTKPHNWRAISEFDFKILTAPEDCQLAYDVLKTSDLISVDIETKKEPVPHIAEAGYTGFWFNPDGSTRSFSYVMPIKTMEHVLHMRRFNELPQPKVMQNGKYDLSYFFRYNSPLHNYLYDLINAFHSWYCEMPKDLASASAFLLRDSMYWKDLAQSNDFVERCRYNALDTWVTGEAFISWLLAAPDWAKRNYVMEFSVVPACHMCEMTGIKRDMEALERFAKKAEESQEKLLKRIRVMTNVPNFNPSSPKQCVALLKILGEKDGERKKLSSDEAQLEATSYKHPLNERILGDILEYRGERKLSSTYLTTGEKAKEFGPPGKERILYSLNPHGTDTGRLASKEHHFWCGLQIQNVPADSDVKESIIADDGWELWEADFSQAEDRGVSVKSGDPSLLGIFESGKDSHSYKAAMFFGLEYFAIYDEVNEKVILKDIRQLGKKINHGANYNMGASVLIKTMGPKKIREAQVLLKLPKHWTLEGVAKHLLNLYEKAFPTVKTAYYQSIIKEVRLTNKLVGDTGFTRYCFGDPLKNKPDLNAYVAHVTQSLNAMNLNKAFLAVFLQLGFLPTFKLLAQIHDSILFMTKKGHDYLADEVKRLMTFPVPVTDCMGVTRNLIVPVDIKKLGANWRGK